MTDLEICVGCGQRPTLARAEAAVLVVARDHRGVTTALCRRCGAGEDQEDAATGGQARQEAPAKGQG